MSNIDELQELRSLNRKHASETTSIHNDMLALAALVGVHYDGLSSPAGFLHGDIMPAIQRLAAALRAIAEAPEYDMNAAGQPSACAMADIAREALPPTLTVDDVAVMVGADGPVTIHPDDWKAAHGVRSELPDMGQPEFQQSAEDKWFAQATRSRRYHRKVVLRQLLNHGEQLDRIESKLDALDEGNR